MENSQEIEKLPKNVFLIRLLDQLKQTSNGRTDGKEGNSTPINNLAPIKTNETETSSPAEKLTNDQQTSKVPYAKALYDFHMNPLEDEGCLKFMKGMVIEITRRVDQNWAEGKVGFGENVKIGESIGIFPLSFVNLNPAASALMQSYATKWRLPASSNDQTPSTSTSPQRQFPQPLLQPTPVHSVLQVMHPISPQSSQILEQVALAGAVLGQDKTGIYVALHNYAPQKADELELKKGSQYIVKETCQDGWFKGLCSDNLFSKGVFPGNYVMPLLYHQKMISMQRNVALQAQTNKTNCNTQHIRAGAAYINLGLSSVPPELPQRNITNRSVQTPISQQNKSVDKLPTCPSQKTDDIANKMKRETVTEMLMKRLGYSRKSTDSSAYSMDNPVFEDAFSASSASHSLQHNHMRSGSCPIDLGLTSANVENLHFGSQRVRTRERALLPM